MTSDKLKALRETFQREAPNALADLSMSDDEYSGVQEWARCCPACGERDDCEHKLLGRALVKIERLHHGFIRIIHEVKAGATDVEVLAICREMLGIEVVNND